jgi:hypothetical protein
MIVSFATHKASRQPTMSADEGGLSDEQLYGLKDGEVSTGVRRQDGGVI